MIKQIINLLIVLIIVSACTYSNASIKNNKAELKNKKLNVQHLNLESFKDKVWDFEKGKLIFIK